MKYKIYYMKYNNIMSRMISKLWRRRIEIDKNDTVKLGCSKMQRIQGKTMKLKPLSQRLIIFKPEVFV